MALMINNNTPATMSPMPVASIGAPDASSSTSPPPTCPLDPTNAPPALLLLLPALVLALVDVVTLTVGTVAAAEVGAGVVVVPPTAISVLVVGGVGGSVGGFGVGGSVGRTGRSSKHNTPLPPLGLLSRSTAVAFGNVCADVPFNQSNDAFANENDVCPTIPIMLPLPGVVSVSVAVRVFSSTLVGFKDESCFELRAEAAIEYCVHLLIDVLALFRSMANSRYGGTPRPSADTKKRRSRKKVRFFHGSTHACDGVPVVVFSQHPAKSASVTAPTHGIANNAKKIIVCWVVWDSATEDKLIMISNKYKYKYDFRLVNCHESC